MNGLSKDKLILDTANLSESDNIGAFIRSAAGDLITHTVDGGKKRLDVSTGVERSEDSGHTSGDIGTFVLAVRNDSNAVLTSTDLDYSPIAVDDRGRVKVLADIVAGAEYAEDSASSDGDIGDFVLAVRQDTLLSSVTVDGDYAAFKLNDRGALWSVPVGTVSDDAVDSENPVKVGSKSKFGVLTALSTTGDRADLLSDKYRRVYVNSGSNIGVNQQAVSVGLTAATLLAAASQISGRRTYLIQNLGTKAIFIGKDSSVTVSDGFRVAAGATFSVELGADVELFAISNGASQDIRLLEVA